MEGIPRFTGSYPTLAKSTCFRLLNEKNLYDTDERTTVETAYGKPCEDCTKLISKDAIVGWL